MSVAFTKEDSTETASETLLPDRPVSPHPNLVTEAGLKALEAALQQALAFFRSALEESLEIARLDSVVKSIKHDRKARALVLDQGIQHRIAHFGGGASRIADRGHGFARIGVLLR